LNIPGNSRVQRIASSLAYRGLNWKFLAPSSMRTRALTATSAEPVPPGASSVAGPVKTYHPSRDSTFPPAFLKSASDHVRACHCPGSAEAGATGGGVGVGTGGSGAGAEVT